jgi:hypothetical protein
MIKKEGSSYNVYTANGSRKLGSHKTKSSALRQLRAIEWSKHKNDKKRKSHPSKRKTLNV